MLDRIALILVIIGGINWGSIGLFKFDIVGWICGGQDAEMCIRDSINAPDATFFQSTFWMNSFASLTRRSLVVQTNFLASSIDVYKRQAIHPQAAV